MARFHELRQTAGKSPLDALIQAQREFIADRLQLVRLTPGEKTAVTRRQSELALARGLILEPAAIPEPPMSRPHPFYWAAFELLGEWR
jgi:CHAT domain-containing protein